jgi:hypothetical protein
MPSFHEEMVDGPSTGTAVLDGDCLFTLDQEPTARLPVIGLVAGKQSRIFFE